MSTMNKENLVPTRGTKGPSSGSQRSPLKASPSRRGSTPPRKLAAAAAPRDEGKRSPKRSSPVGSKVSPPRKNQAVALARATNGSREPESVPMTQGLAVMDACFDRLPGFGSPTPPDAPASFPNLDYDQPLQTIPSAPTAPIIMAPAAIGPSAPPSTVQQLFGEDTLESAKHIEKTRLTIELSHANRTGHLLFDDEAELHSTAGPNALSRGPSAQRPLPMCGDGGFPLLSAVADDEPMGRPSSLPWGPSSNNAVMANNAFTPSRPSQFAFTPSGHPSPRPSIATELFGSTSSPASQSQPNQSNTTFFDPVVQSRWVGQVIEQLKKKLPEDIDDFQDDNCGTVPPLPNVSDDDATGDGEGIQIKVDLYKKLFSCFKSFHMFGDSNGKLLVADAFDTLLKLRLRRIHQCLLKTYYVQLVDVLAVKYPALHHHRQGRVWRQTSVVLPSSFRDLVAQWMRIQAIQDVLCAPCDNKTYAGVIEYCDRLGKDIVAQLFPLNIIGTICKSISSIECYSDEASMDDGAAQDRYADRMEELAGLWEMLLEVVNLCVDESNSATNCVFLEAVKKHQLLGRICYGVVNAGCPAAQRTAASILEKLATTRDFKDFVVTTLKEHPLGFTYLLPPLYSGDLVVQTQTAAALVSLFPENRLKLYPALYRLPEYFTDGIETARDPTALSLVLCELILPNPAPFADYGKFHEAVLTATVTRLRTAAHVATRTKFGNQCIPLYQYIIKLVTQNDGMFLPLLKTLRVLGLVRSISTSNNRLSSTGGGASGGPLRQLLKLLEPYAQYLQERA